MINKFQFEADVGLLGAGAGGRQAEEVKRRLGIVNPLDGAVVHPEVCE